MGTVGRALVIGGGIGGLAAARALQRIGWEVLVRERSPDLRELGAGLSLWSNAVRGLDRLGLGQETRAIGASLEVCELRTWRGRLTGVLPSGAIGLLAGAPSLGVHRADLLALLAGSIDPAGLRLGADCLGFEEDAAGVTAHFAAGPPEHADLLIGADGLHSTIRARLFGPARPRYAGYTCWRGITSLTSSLLDPGLAIEWVGRGRRFGMMPLGRADRSVYWFATLRTPPGGEADPGGSRWLLRDLFRGWAAPVGEIIDATEETAILRHDIFDRPPIRRWGTNRVVLLGDAAHPTTPTQGQGACQAIEDAVALARHLLGEPSVPAALRAYEADRYCRTALVINQSRLFGWVGHWQSPAAARIREALLRLATPTVITWQLERLLSHDATALSNK